MASLLSRLDHLNGVHRLQGQILLRPTFYNYFRESVSGEYHMYQIVLLHSCDYLEKTSIKKTWRMAKSNGWNEMWHWTNDEIGVAVQRWLWMRVNSNPDSSVGQSVWMRFNGCGFKYHSGQLSIATLENPSVVNTICISSFSKTHVIT